MIYSKRLKYWVSDFGPIMDLQCAPHHHVQMGATHAYLKLHCDVLGFVYKTKYVDT